MAQLDKAALTSLAEQIKNESTKKANTSERIGDILLNFIDSLNNTIDDGSPLQFKEIDYTTEWYEGSPDGDGLSNEVDWTDEWDASKPLYAYIEMLGDGTQTSGIEFFFEILGDQNGISIFDLFQVKVASGETYTKIWRIDHMLSGNLTQMIINPNFEVAVQKLTVYQWY